MFAAFINETLQEKCTLARLMVPEALTTRTFKVHKVSHFIPTFLILTVVNHIIIIIIFIINIELKCECER